MSSTSSSPPDASNVVHGVFPTQALRVGDGRRLSPERLAEEATRGVEKGGVAAAENSGERDAPGGAAAVENSGERDTPGPPAEEAQASFAFIAGDEKGRSSELSQGPSPVADVLLHAAQATVGEVMTAEPLQVAEGTRVLDALEMLRRHKISELPVVAANGRPVGLIDITDLIGLAPPEATASRAEVA